MTSYHFQTWDVFSARKFAGNQLAVLMEAGGLTDEEMQAITREFNYAESTFVLPPENPANTARIRIFTPGYEMPFAGHPTLGTALAIAKARDLSGEIRLELNAGVFPVEVFFSGDSPFARFQNPNLPQERGAAPAAAALEAALGVADGKIDRNAHAPRRIGAGVDFIYACAPIDAVRKAKLNVAKWEALDLQETIGVYLYAESGDSADADWHVRMFAPDAGVNEDPATGSAAAAFPGQLTLADSLADGSHRWVIEQGVELGRPSRIEVDCEINAGAIESIKVGGAAVHVSTGQIFV